MQCHYQYMYIPGRWIKILFWESQYKKLMAFIQERTVWNRLQQCSVSCLMDQLL